MTGRVPVSLREAVTYNNLRIEFSPGRKNMYQLQVETHCDTGK
jgi:hypothetical protein